MIRMTAVRTLSIFRLCLGRTGFVFRLVLIALIGISIVSKVTTTSGSSMIDESKISCLSS